MIKTSLIIPTYNEVRNIPFLVEEIFSCLDKEKIDLELIIVDDNSPDGTGEEAEALKSYYPIKVIHRPVKLGLGSAVVAGMKSSEREFLGVMDGDLSHDPIILNDLILSLKNFDITIGSRFKDGSIVNGWTFWRKAISIIGMLLSRMLVKEKDPLSGFFFLKRKVVDDIKLKTNGYKILLEILVKGNYQKTKEFPYCFRMRKYSMSKLNYKEFLLFLKQIIELGFCKIYKSP